MRSPRAFVRRLGDAEKVVVVAALLAHVLDHEGVVGRVDRGEADATNVFVQAVFECADAALGVGLVRRGRHRGNVGGGAQQVVQRDHAAAVQLKDGGLQALGAPVLQISLDGLDVALVVLHVAVCGLRVVRHCSTECFLAIVPASALTFQEAEVIE
jgi:hypothetical protein